MSGYGAAAARCGNRMVTEATNPFISQATNWKSVVGLAVVRKGEE
jgi:hypothetical protein